MYFIQIDEDVIKFGITKDIHYRLNTHRKKFVNKLNLIKHFKILMIYKFTNDILNETVENKFKKYLASSNNNFTKYNETEVILFYKLDQFIEKIDNIIEKIIKKNNIIDGGYDLLPKNEIDEIYKDIMKNTEDSIKIDKKRKKYKANTIINNSKKNTKNCLRCGKKYARLKQHIQSKNVCSPMYMDIDREIMYKNYDIFYKKFLKIKKNGEYKKPCIVCSKHIMSKNMSRHVFTKHPQYENNDIQNNDIQTNDIQYNDIQSNDIQYNDIQSNDIQTNDIQSNDIQSNDIQTNDIQSNDIQNNELDNMSTYIDEINLDGNKSTFIPIIKSDNINNFGSEEDNINLTEILQKYNKNQDNLEYMKLFVEYTEHLHMKTNKNMNIYRDKKTKYARYYDNGKWIYIRAADLFMMIAKNTLKHINLNLEKLNIIQDDNYIQLVIELNKYIETVIENKIDWKIFNEFIDILLLNYKVDIKRIHKIT